MCKGLFMYSKYSVNFKKACKFVFLQLEGDMAHFSLGSRLLLYLCSFFSKCLTLNKLDTVGTSFSNDPTFPANRTVTTETWPTKHKVHFNWTRLYLIHSVCSAELNWMFYVGGVWPESEEYFTTHTDDINSDTVFFKKKTTTFWGDKSRQKEVGLHVMKLMPECWSRQNVE